MVEMLEERLDVLCMDFRGHGRSSGLYTFSAREGADLGAVLDWARVSYVNIAIIGFSLGAAIAINTVSRRHREVHGLIAVSAPCAFDKIDFKFWTPEAIRSGLLGLEPGAGCRPGNPALKKERPLDTIKRIRDLPVLFIHGTKDATVGLHHSRRLYAVAAEPKRLEIIEGGGHAEILFRDDPDGFLGIVESWLVYRQQA